MRTTLLFPIILLFFLTGTPQGISQPVIELELAYSGDLGEILGITHAGDERLFAVRQNGRIMVIDEAGTVNANPFLNIRNKISTGGERGLLGMAFHPNYAENGFFYVNYTQAGDGATVVSRFSVSQDNPNKADSLSEKILLIVEQPFSNHNGGDIKFGPDGYLYIGMGDGGSGGDPMNLSQTATSLLGKMLRIDVDNGEPYGIPADNPWAGRADTLEEIWAFGVRNPWRFSFDAATGDLWIGDVGQNEFEEINFVEAGAAGINYGWRCYEGDEPYNMSQCNPNDEYTFPVYVYSQNQGDRSVTGGYVYRGEDYPLLQGTYVFGDFVSGQMFTVRPDGDDWTGERILEFGGGQITSFGENVHNELFMAARGDAAIYRVTEFCSTILPTIDIVDNHIQLSLASGLSTDSVRIVWFLDNVEVEAADSGTLFPFVSGNYRADIFHPKGCNLSSNTLDVIASSTSEYSWPAEVQVFPNPVNELFTVSSGLSGKHILSILNSNGALIAQQTFNDSGNLEMKINAAAGLYILRLENEAGTWFKKIIRN
ncbi:MAG: PQQ-dependent sugar dehydrogenase [Saprospiraceae bacterium]|nr:PQQ-dependent sugar dehydrogenase [Saprospiraceae bacterium]